MSNNKNIITYSEHAPSKEYVQNMFNSLANNYDELNHKMSWGVDRSWRKSAINHLKQFNNIDSILDIATGTGDLSILAFRELKPKEIIGVDISTKMLEIGIKKIKENRMSDNIHLMNADCANLPFEENRFDAVISAFALRNFENLEDCLSEIYRVLKPGGIISIIDLCDPIKFPMKQLFWCYKKLIMPLFGRIVSHTDSAYKYLPYTMSIIPQGEDMCKHFSSAGFKNMIYKRLKFQMCILYSGIK